MRGSRPQMSTCRPGILREEHLFHLAVATRRISHYDNISICIVTYLQRCNPGEILVTRYFRQYLTPQKLLCSAIH